MVNTSSSVPCKSKDWKVLTSETQQLKKWNEHDKEALNTAHQRCLNYRTVRSRTRHKFRGSIKEWDQEDNTQTEEW